MEKKRYHIKWRFGQLEQALQMYSIKPCLYMCILKNPMFKGFVQCQDFDFYEVVYIGETGDGFLGRVVGQEHKNILSLFRDVMFEEMYIGVGEFEEELENDDLKIVERILISLVKPRLNNKYVIIDIENEGISIINTYVEPTKHTLIPDEVFMVLVGMDAIYGGVCETCGDSIEKVLRSSFSGPICHRCWLRWFFSKYGPRECVECVYCIEDGGISYCRMEDSPERKIIDIDVEKVVPLWCKISVENQVKEYDELVKQRAEKG